MKSFWELLSVLLLFAVIIFGLFALSSEPMIGVIILVGGGFSVYGLRKLARYDVYKKKMYDLTKESVELQKKNLNNTDED